MICVTMSDNIQQTIEEFENELDIHIMFANIYFYSTLLHFLQNRKDPEGQLISLYIQ